MELMNKISEWGHPDDVLLASKYITALQTNCNRCGDLMELYFDDIENVILKYAEEDEILVFELTKIFYQALAPFCSKSQRELFAKLFSLNERYLAWFSPLNDLLEEISLVNSGRRIYVPYSLAVFNYYNCYLPTKIYQVLFQAFKFQKKYDERKSNIVSVELFKMLQNFENRKKAGKAIVKSTAEMEILGIIQQMEERGVGDHLNTSPVDLFRKEASGKVEHLYLKPIYDNSIAVEASLDDNEKRVLLFDIFRFMMKDKRWLSEKDFVEMQDALYSNNYRKYQNLTMRKFMTGK